MYDIRALTFPVLFVPLMKMRKCRVFPWLKGRSIQTWTMAWSSVDEFFLVAKVLVLLLDFLALNLTKRVQNESHNLYSILIEDEPESQLLTIEEHDTVD